MQNEITVSPLVDILSEKLGKQVVMSEGDYVVFETLEVVSASDIEMATEKQLEDSMYDYRLNMKLTARQARLVLLQEDKLSDVATSIAALPSPEKEIAEVTWEYAVEIERLNPFVEILGTSLNMTDAEIDTLFINGAKL